VTANIVTPNLSSRSTDHADQTSRHSGAQRTASSAGLEPQPANAGP
jgi:hypothetical protein